MLDPLRFVGRLQTLYPFWRDADAIQATRENSFRALLAHAVKHSPYYRKRFAGIDIARCALSDLPTLSKREMMENFDDIVTDRRLKKADLSTFVAEPKNLGRYYLGAYGVSHTSGSQGQPAIIVQDRDALSLVFAIQFARGTKLKRRFLPHLGRLLKPARMALLTIKPGFFPSAAAFAYLPGYLKPMLKILHVSVSDPIEESNRKLEEFRPEYITAYSSAIEPFAREQVAGRLRLTELDCVKQITNVSEPITAETAEWLEKVFGAHVSDEYAMGECMALSSGCTSGRGAHINSDLAILEVVDDQYRPVPPGTEGSKVLMTNLYNTVQPFIRYEVDDRVTMSPDTGPCVCGSLHPRIAKISGRSKDLLSIEVAGRRQEVPYYFFLTALHHILEIAEHQVVQTGPRTIVVRTVPLPGKEVPVERLRDMLTRVIAAEGLAETFDLEIEVLREIPRGPSGKIMRVKNEYATLTS